MVFIILVLINQNDDKIERESRFTLYQNDAHVRVWRQPKEAYAVDCLVPTYKHGGMFRRQ